MDLTFVGKKDMNRVGKRLSGSGKMKSEDTISIKTVAMRLTKRCPNGVICKINDKIEDVIKHGGRIGYKDICQKCWEGEIRSWKDE